MSSVVAADICPSMVEGVFTSIPSHSSKIKARRNRRFRQAFYENCSVLFICVFVQQVIEQGAHVIAAAIQNTVDVDIAALHTVKHHIIAADKVTVFAANISD